MTMCRFGITGNAPAAKAAGAFPVYEHIGLLDSEVRKARSWVAQAELILIIGAEGSYGGVYYPYIRSNAKIVQINPKSTQFDDISTVNMREKADDVFYLLL